MAGMFHTIVELFVKLAAKVLSAEPYTHGKQAVNLRRHVSYAMMIPTSYAIPNNALRARIHNPMASITAAPSPIRMATFSRVERSTRPGIPVP